MGNRRHLAPAAEPARGRYKARHAQNKAGKRWRENRTTVRNVQTATERRRLDARSASLPRQRDRSAPTWKRATTQPAQPTRLIPQMKTTTDKDPSPYRCHEGAFFVAGHPAGPLPIDAAIK